MLGAPLSPFRPAEERIPLGNVGQRRNKVSPVPIRGRASETENDLSYSGRQDPVVIDLTTADDDPEFVLGVRKGATERESELVVQP